ncbi:MAG TPA: Fe-S protein assembly co-chaperone HscB [Bacteroidia bacterium]
MNPSIELPDTKNCFKFYELEQVYNIDKVILKEKYLEKSKLYHPDFHTGDQRLYQIAVSASAFNNQAFKTLDNDISRASHLLELNQSESQENAKLPQAFLMEMMELNEAIDEINDDNRYDLEDQINAFKKSGKAEIAEFAIKLDWDNLRMAILKWRYLERLENRLSE